ncbi:hypothetical protein H2203_007774 [Taxawa tesnikishii (nom. ined.)]|nr:hypothetical protein H2203_007774 [Dothideales sp. JES 119]
MTVYKPRYPVHIYLVVTFDPADTLNMPHAESENRPLRIAIAGGGIGGLCLAVGLVKQPHLDVHIYEGVAEYSDIGSGLALHMNAIKGMDLIDPSIKKTYFAKALGMAEEADKEMTTQVILAAGPHMGEVVAELGRAKGRKTVARSDLLDGLLELLPKDRVTFGKKLETIKESEEGVTLQFKDGTSAQADVMLGCDGVHSITRAYLLGADHPATQPGNPDGWQVTNRMVPMDEALEAGVDESCRHNVAILCGHAGHLNHMPLHMGKTLSIQVVRRKGEDDGSTTAKYDTKPWEDYSKEARTFVELVSRDPTNSWVLQDHEHAPYYNKGRIAMMGDAAHAAMPFVGNGAAQAIEDAAVLTALLSRVHDTQQAEKALAAYDEVRRPRSQTVVEMGRDFGRMYGFALDNIHEDPDKMKAKFAKSAAFTNNFDVAGQNEKAVELYEARLKA